eukprot:3861411-Amphidinium_carterae.1
MQTLTILSTDKDEKSWIKWQTQITFLNTPARFSRELALAGQLLTKVAIVKAKYCQERALP